MTAIFNPFSNNRFEILIHLKSESDFDKAVESSKEAEALAKASIFQATSEKTLWKNMEIR